MNAKSNNYLAVIMMAAGFLLIVLGWNGAANLDFVQGQIPFVISGGIAGLGLLGGGIGLTLVLEIRRSNAVLEAKFDELIQAVGGGVTSSDTQRMTTLVGSGNLTERQRKALERAGAGAN